MITLENEMEAGNKFAFTHGKPYDYLIMRGTPEFINRTTNLLFNHGILLRGEVYQIDFDTFYILTPESRLIKGLAGYFHGELYNSSDSDEEITQKAIKKAKNFFNTYMKNSQGSLNLLGKKLDSFRKKDLTSSPAEEYHWSLNDFNHKENA